MRILHVATCICILAIMILSPTCLVCDQTFGNAYSLESRLFTVLSANGTQKMEAFSSVQQAINEADAGSTLLIPSGTYYERLIVNKSVTLVGQIDLSTVVDGNNSGTVIQITASDVEISYLKVQNSGYGWTNHGVYVYKSENCSIRNNHLFRTCHNIKLNYSANVNVSGNWISGVLAQPTMYGIRVENSVNCTTQDNKITDCVAGIHLENASDCVVRRNSLDGNNQGIRFYSPCVDNLVLENTVCNGAYDGMIEIMPTNTTLHNNHVFHNNFVNNTQAFIYKTSGTTWDDGYPSGGNYWSRHNNTDLNRGGFQNETGCDGIADAPYAVNAYDRDRYPLAHPFDSVLVAETGLNYLTIQQAIDALETLTGYAVIVKQGIYAENLFVNKTVSLMGEKPNCVIDGRNNGTVLTVVADNVTVSGFTIRNSGSNYPPYGNDCGILLDRCVGSNISYNVIEQNRIGLYASFSEDIVLQQNNILSNSENGLWLWYSRNSTLIGNNITSNTYGFGVFGSTLRDFDNNVDVSNVVNGKPIRYLVNHESEICDEKLDTATIYLVNCRNMTIRNLDLKGNAHGAFLYNVTGSLIQNLTVSHNNYGISLQSSSGNIVNSSLSLENWAGIHLEGSSNNTIENSKFRNNEKGVSFYESRSNTVRNNGIERNSYGVRLFHTSFSWIWGNNLVENTIQASLINAYQNFWNNSVEGNFWSDLPATDLQKDGISDESKIIDSSNIDYHPLMGQFSPFSVSYEDQLYCIGVTSNSTILGFQISFGSTTILLTINGTEGTGGFCRIGIPHALVEPEISVTIDNGLTQIQNFNSSVFDDGSTRWIYFEYHHSTHEILIVSEFHFLIFYLVLVAGALLHGRLSLTRRKKSVMLDSSLIDDADGSGIVNRTLFQKI